MVVAISESKGPKDDRRDAFVLADGPAKRRGWSRAPVTGEAPG